MANARLIIRSPGQVERKVEINGEVAIGRAPDNVICIDDRMVSQYHAVIEKRGDAFWLSDLGSTNGTAVNGESVTAERQLRDGDLIFTGNIAYATFERDDSSPPPQSHSAELQEGQAASAPPAVSGSATQPPAVPVSRVSPWLIIAAAVAGIVLAGSIVLLAAGAFTDSDGAVRVLSPETGSTIRGPQIIRIDVEEIKGIDEVIYLLDGVEFASAEHPPFEVTLDPSELQTKVRNLASGNHVLTVTVQDKDGNKTPQPDTILLAFDVGGTPPDIGDVKKTGETTDKESLTPGTQPGSVDVASLSRNLAATISGKSWYDFDPQLADEIRRRTGAYRINVTDDASRYRRQIGNAFNSKGLPPAIGFVIALSESQFKEAATTPTSGSNGQKIGFWQVPRQIALEQGYILPDESAAALSDVRRSAEIAAAYINDLVNAFGGMDHFMYAIACYGLPLNQAAKVRARLEEIDPTATDRRDFWRMVKAGVVSRDGAERVTKFFAAGIVGENPRSFGLNARPLSSLY